MHSKKDAIFSIKRYVPAVPRKPNESAEIKAIFM
jgi:hypothetical protein